jgi:hypothetical protein
MDSSSAITPEKEIYNDKDFKKHSKRNSGGIEALIILFYIFHS